MSEDARRRERDLFAAALDPSDPHERSSDPVPGVEVDRERETEPDILSSAAASGLDEDAAARAAEAEADQVLADTPISVPTRALPPPDPLDDVPARIGPYRILERVGEGGMGAVWVAEQLEPVRRRVAIKLIKPGMASRQVLARFESERQALALMSHPHIARILDAGATESARPYFVMEYVPGLSITRYCDNRKLGLRERLELFLDVCSAIEHAHQRGIIHRDIKPSNILVAEEGSQPLAKVIDFGIAKATSQRLSELTVHTRLGVLMGTPEYMSPEQADVTPLDVDTRSDVYSLGAVLYQLLVGVPILEFGDDLSAAGIQRTILEIDPMPPSQRLLRMDEEQAREVAARRDTDAEALRRRLRGDLDWITMKALEKDRGRRYSFATELAADLRNHLEHRPVLAGPPSAIYRLRKAVRRHRVASVSAALVFVSLLVGAWGAWGWWQAARGFEVAQRFGQDVAGLEWQLRVSHMSPVHDLSDEYRRLEARLDEIARETAELGRRAQAPGEYAIGRGLLALGRVDDAMPHLEAAWRRDLRSPPVAYARGIALGRLYDRAYDRARAVRDPELREVRIAQAREEYRDPALQALGSGRASASAPLPYVDALIAYYEGRHDDARRQIAAALAEAPWLWEAPKLEGDVLMDLVASYYEKNERERGNETWLAARAAYERATALAPSSPEAYLGQCTAANYRLYQSLNDRDSQEVFSRLREIAEDACGQLERVLPGHPRLPYSFANLHLMSARQLIAQGGDPRSELEVAQRFAERGVELRPDSAMAMRALGDSLMLRGQYGWERGEDVRDVLDEAGRTFARAAELEPSPQAANNGANAYLLKSRIESARGIDPTRALDEAEELYRLTTELSPSNVAAKGNITLVVRDRAKWEAEHGRDPRPHLLRAAAIMDELLEHAPELAYLYNFDASLAGDLIEAQTDWGGDASAWIERGRASASRSMELAPDRFGAYWSLAQVESAAARHEAKARRDPAAPARAALAALSRYEELFPSQTRAARMRASVYLQIARYAHARGRDPDDALRAARAELERSLTSSEGEAREALPLLAEVHLLELDAHPDRAPSRLGEALAVAERLAAERPEHAASLVVAARLELWQCRIGAGAAQCNDALDHARRLLAQAGAINPARQAEIASLLDEAESLPRSAPGSAGGGGR